MVTPTVCDTTLDLSELWIERHVVKLAELQKLANQIADLARGVKPVPPMMTVSKPLTTNEFGQSALEAGELRALGAAFVVRV